LFVCLLVAELAVLLARHWNKQPNSQSLNQSASQSAS